MATYAADLEIQEGRVQASLRETRMRLLPLLSVLAAASVPYIATLRYGFVYDDDIQILGTPIVRSWCFVPSFFIKPIPVFVSRYYRPLFFVWLRVNFSLWNTRAWGWHLTNILLHAAVCLLVMAVLRRYFRDPRCALAGALIFAVHPAHVESVAWISGCSDPLMAAGLLGALLFWMKNRELPSIALRLGSLICGASALLIKETGVILPILIWLHACAEIPTGSAKEKRVATRLISSLRDAAPYAALTALFLAVRHFALRGVPALSGGAPVLRAILTVPSVLLFYLRHLVWPTALSVCYDFQIVTRASRWLFWVPLAILVGIGTGIWMWFKRNRDSRVILASLWCIVPVLPVSFIRFFGSDDFVHDRYLYLSVFGVSIFIGQLWELLSSYEERRERSWLPLALVAALIASLAIATAVQAEPWQSNLSLYTNAVRAAPSNSLARNGLANEYINEQRYDEAADVLRKLVRDRPEVWIGNYNWGYFNYVVGNPILADEYLHRAIQINPTDAHQYIVLGETYLKEGRLQDAADALRQGIARRPDGMGYHLVLGLALMRQGNLIGARQEMLAEIDAHPENAAARELLQHLDQQVAPAPR